jgi:hypothetical protein
VEWRGRAAARRGTRGKRNARKAMFFILFSPRRGEGGARTNEVAPIRVACRLLPPPRRGGCFDNRSFPRVALRPLCSGLSSTRGYTPPPRRGGCVSAWVRSTHPTYFGPWTLNFGLFSPASKEKTGMKPRLARALHIFYPACPSFPSCDTIIYIERLP